MGRNTMTAVLIRIDNLDTLMDPHSGGRPCEDTGRYSSDTFLSQRVPVVPTPTRTCKRQGRILPKTLQRDHDPTDTLNSAFNSSLQNCGRIHICF